MMQIDTSAVIGWADKTVVLEFEHYREDEYPDHDGRRSTAVRLVEVRDQPPRGAIDYQWRECARSWKRTVAGTWASCSPRDQYNRETGRRIALRRLNAALRGTDKASLTAATIRQYFENRSQAP